MSLPTSTPEQRAAALEKAAAARTARAGLKARVRNGEITFADALRDEAAARLKVSALIESVPGVGKVRAAQIMGRLKIAGSRRVSGLGANQRAALAAELAPVSD